MDDATREIDPATRDLLLGAAGYMGEHGHCKRQLRDDDGRVCLMGSLHSAASLTLAEACELVDEHAPRDRARATYCDAVNALRNAIGDFIPAWNDREETTQEDAILALKRAAHGERL